MKTLKLYACQTGFQRFDDVYSFSSQEQMEARGLARDRHFKIERVVEYPEVTEENTRHLKIENPNRWGDIIDCVKKGIKPEDIVGFRRRKLDDEVFCTNNTTFVTDIIIRDGSMGV